MKFAVMALIAGCVEGGRDSAELQLDPRMEGMLEAHNAVRANVQPAANPPLEPLAWSNTLAHGAAEHAAKCVWEHSTNLQELNQGENLAAWSIEGDATAQDAVTGWASEVALYDYDTNGCTGVCGHYTQIVWRDSREVGCAIGSCPGGLDGWAEGKEIWVCRYSPPGNWVGEKPY